MITESLNRKIDSLILILLTIQILSVFYSVAVSSIAFGIWGGIWIIQMAINKKAGFENKNILELKYPCIFFFLFLVFEILSRIFAIIPDGALITLKSYLLFMIVCVSITKIENKDILAKIIFSILIIVSLVSLYELVTYFINIRSLNQNTDIAEYRIGFLGYPISMGEIKMLLLLLVFPLLFASNKIFISKLYLVLLMIPIGASMYLTQSRNVLVAVFISLLIYGIIINKRFLVLYTAILIIFWLLIPSQFQGRLLSIFNPSHPSNASRLVMWDVGIKMFKDHPVLGIGDNEFTQVYKTYKEPKADGEGSHLHSNFMMILVTKGIFGFIFYISFFISLFIKQIKYYKKVSGETDKLLILGTILAMISFHISGIFEWNFGDWKVMTVLLFILSVPFVIYNYNFKNNLIKK